MAHYASPATLADNCRQLVLRQDCGKCAKYILVLIHDFGYLQWSAHKSAHQWHNGGHTS